MKRRPSYDGTSGPLGRDRLPAPEGHRGGHASSGGGRQRPPLAKSSRARTFRAEDVGPALPRWEWLKNSLPALPSVSGRSRVRERMVAEDEAAEPFSPPPRRKRDWETASEAPRQNRRDRERSLDREIPPEQSDRPSATGTRRRKGSVILKVILALFLLGTCSTTSFALTKLYQVYAIAQSVTGKALPNVGTTNGNVRPTTLPDSLSGISAFNMLLLGSDNDAKFSSGAVLTQTDIVVRIDLANHKVTMVSIPRDMWIPSDKGDCCYKLDEISGAITNGPSTPLLNGLAHTVATVENDFGIPISAYAWVGLQGFVNVINTLGGVDVDVLHPIVDDSYPKDLDPNGDPYAYQRLYIPAGPQHLDGEQALNYVRSRHSDQAADFGRSQRQQSVLTALKKKLDGGTVLSNLEELANDLKGSVITSLTISQVIALANFAKELKPTDMLQQVLSAPTYGQATSVNGKYVIQPNWEAINTTVKGIFQSAPPVVKLHGLTAEDKQTVANEKARILIENGTNTEGVAAQLETVLKSEGFNVVRSATADNQVHQATLIQEFIPSGQDASQFDGTCLVLSKMLGVMYQASGASPPDGIDIVIVVGYDTAAQIQQQA